MKLRHLVILSIALAAATCARGPAIDPQQVTASFVQGPLPVDDPASRLWAQASEHPATLMPQDVVEPRLVEPGVPLVRVRVLHNGSQVVFRLEWDDGSRDVIPDTGTGSDSVAIQFPVQPGADVPDAAMGEAGKPVQIAYWKAVWQDDAERAGSGRDRVDALYPNASIDHYPYDANPAARDELMRRYAPARAAGNPITVRPNAGPVQELVAEGYGTTTVSAMQRATGLGEWRDGRWTVTIARPLEEGAGMANLVVGRTGYVAFAVWDGSARQTGARKMRSGWIRFVLESP